MWRGCGVLAWAGATAVAAPGVGGIVSAGVDMRGLAVGLRGFWWDIRAEPFPGVLAITVPFQVWPARGRPAWGGGMECALYGSALQWGAERRRRKGVLTRWRFSLSRMKDRSAAIGAGRRRQARSRYPPSSRRSIRPPALARAAAMRGTADLGSLPSGLDAPTTAPLQRVLVIPTRQSHSAWERR